MAICVQTVPPCVPQLPAAATCAHLTPATHTWALRKTPKAMLPVLTCQVRTKAPGIRECGMSLTVPCGSGPVFSLQIL